MPIAPIRMPDRAQTVTTASLPAGRPRRDERWTSASSVEVFPFWSHPSIPMAGPFAAVAERLADLAVEAMLLEVYLTPKPGLVDRRNTGSHRDMTLQTFVVSAGAIRPSLDHFFGAGVAHATKRIDTLLETIRPIGLHAERAMSEATGGVNTHKGAIFAFGLLLAAAGRTWALSRRLTPQAVCGTVAAMTAGLVERELADLSVWRTAGERLFRDHGLTGARGEAESGFASVVDGALPELERRIAGGQTVEIALSAAFLHLLAYNDDTNLAHRGGIEGLRWAQSEARRVLEAGGIDLPDYRKRMEALDDAFIGRNLSPGGSADLLAVTWFLAQLDHSSI